MPWRLSGHVRADPSHTAGLGKVAESLRILPKSRDLRSMPVDPLLQAFALKGYFHANKALHAGGRLGRPLGSGPRGASPVSRLAGARWAVCRHDGAGLDDART